MFDIEDMIRLANVYLAAKDKNFKCIYCSESVAELLDLDSPKQVIGKTDYDFGIKKIADIYRMGDIQVLKSGRGYQSCEPQLYEGKIVEAMITRNPLKDKFGSIRGVIASCIKLPDMAFGKYFEKSKNATQRQFFTKREYIIFHEVIRGATAKEIAKKLLLSPRTVEDYIHRIKIKLQCDSKYHIAEAAMRLGIL